MLSYLRGLQPLQAQPHAGHPGSHCPGDHSLLLSGNHRPTTCPRPELRYSDRHRDGHFLTDLYQYANYYPDSDSYLHLHPDDHPSAYRHADSQRYSYIHLDSDPHAHFHAKRNADTNIHTDTDINFHADFHFYRNPHPTDPRHAANTLIQSTFPPISND